MSLKYEVIPIQEPLGYAGASQWLTDTAGMLGGRLVQVSFAAGNAFAVFEITLESARD